MERCRYDLVAWEENVVGENALDELITKLREGMSLSLGPGRQVDTRVATFLWAEALTNERIHASQMKLIEASRPLAVETVRRAQAEGRIDPDLPTEAVMDAMFSMYIGLTVMAAWEPEKDMGPAQKIAESFLDGTFVTQPKSAQTED